MHIEIDFQFTRDKVTSRALFVRFISSKDEFGKIFTMQSKLGIHLLQLIF
jgi:hypothetical protein